MLIESIPFHHDITLLFSHFAEQDRAVLLDSGKPLQAQGRYDIFSAWPESCVQISNGVITHTDSDKNDHLLANMAELLQVLTAAKTTMTSKLPFLGGWIGFASYELGYYLEQAISNPGYHRTLPDFFAGYYSWAVLQDHTTREAFLVYEQTIPAKLLEKIRTTLITAAKPAFFALLDAFRQNTGFAEYQQQFGRIQHYLDAGDCYQVNLALQYQTRYQGSPFKAYQLLRQAVPSPCMAYINAGRQQILSISPERFITAWQSHIETKPIKGTSARHDDPILDQQAAAELGKSGKNRAENLMIVDLLRNDLGRYCKTGSIKADRLFAIESYANVHHLVSTVSGEMKPGTSIWDVFFGSFPGGSITGAPKIRACQIIAELEKAPREIYCGSIFYASNHGVFDASIAIRTLLCDQGEIKAWAGGGIVKDSTAAEEYAECQSKIQRLLQALEFQG